LLLISIIYTLVRLKWQTTENQRPLSDIGYTNIFSDFFNKQHVQRSIRTLTKTRSDKGRACIWAILIAMGFYTFQRDERPMLYLYAQLKLSWDTSIYSWFRTYQSSAYVLMMLIGIPIMTKCLKWRDTILMRIGACSHALGRLIFIFVPSTLGMYIGATTASLGPIVAPVLRSMTSKVVPSSERGVVFSVLSVFDNAVPFISATLYSQLYNASVDWNYPEAIFWLTITTQVFVLLLICLMDYLMHHKQLLPLQISVPNDNALLNNKHAQTISNNSTSSNQT